MPDHYRSTEHSDDTPPAGVCAWLRAADDAVLSFLPLSVTEHIAEGRRHLAGVASRLAELERERSARVVERARSLHEEMASRNATPR
ncbi:MAG: hypothetical protein SF028_15510 [Candidatus Sumerlaeia bacterium]|nr:hypothetical protein [Candidatus Sumerlaeia bacterium]